jgi:hypothetical protein
MTRRESHDAPTPLTGLAAFRRWLTCKATPHTGTSITWDITAVTPTSTRYDHTKWCTDCGRPLKSAERASCHACGQPLSYEQYPDESRHP